MAARDRKERKRETSFFDTEETEETQADRWHENVGQKDSARSRIMVRLSRR